MLNMKNNTNRLQTGQIVSLDLADLKEMLAKVKDKRKARGKKYSLTYLLGSILLAKLSGEQTPQAITHWIKLRWKALAEMFDHTRYIYPCLNTIRNTMMNTMAADDLAKQLRTLLHQKYGGQQSTLIVLDGKTLRGTIPKGKTKGVHLLAAYLPEEGVVLAQELVDKKENEIVVAPKLLDQLDLKGRVVIGDAMFTQRKLSVQVCSQGGHYIWFVKDNQPRLLEDVQRFFQPVEHAAGWHVPPLPQDVATTTNKGHGRLEKRTLTLMADSTGFIQWPALAQVFQVERQITCLRTQKQTTEIAYGITSIPPEQIDAEQLAHFVRSEWGIENGLHYRRDVTLDEDDLRMTSTRQAQTTAILNNFIVGLAAKMGFTNLAKAQRVFDAHISRLLFSYEF